jgi:hypothetical protein
MQKTSSEVFGSRAFHHGSNANQLQLSCPGLHINCLLPLQHNHLRKQHCSCQVQSLLAQSLVLLWGVCILHCHMRLVSRNDMMFPMQGCSHAQAVASQDNEHQLQYLHQTLQHLASSVCCQLNREHTDRVKFTVIAVPAVLQGRAALLCFWATLHLALHT